MKLTFDYNTGSSIGVYSIIINQKTYIMRKVLGWISLDEDEKPNVKEHRIIDGQWLKLAEVFIPGTALSPKLSGIELYVNKTFRPKEGEEKINGGSCVNCGKRRSFHKGIDAFCPAKDEKTMPGVKYD